MPARIVETAYIANISDLKAKMAEAAALQEKAGASLGSAYEKGTSKAGNALKGLSNLGSSFGLPFMGSLDKIGAKFDEAGSHATKFKALVSDVGKLSFAAGVAGAAAAAVEGIHVADSYDKAHASLVAAVKAAGAGMPQWQSQIAATDAKMVQLGFTNAQVESALAHGVVSTQNVGKSLSIMGLAADLSREKNIDLTSAVDLLDKALTGNLRPLRQMGIDLPVVATSAAKLQAAQLAVAEAQARVNALQQQGANTAAAGTSAHSRYATAQLQLATAQYKLNQEASTTSTILDALNQRLGGQASTYAQTFAGRISVLSAQFNKAEQNLGQFLIPKLTELMNFIANHEGVVKDLAYAIGAVLGAAVLVFATETVQKFIGGISSMVSSVEGLVLKWSAASAGMIAEDGAIVAANEAVGASFKAMLGPLAAVAAAAVFAYTQIHALLASGSASGGDLTKLGPQTLLNQLNTDIKTKTPYSLAGFNQGLTKTQGYVKGEHLAIVGGKAVLLGAPSSPGGQPIATSPSGPTPATLAGLAGQAAAASSSSASSALTPAEVALELAGIHQNEALKLASNKATGGSLGQLTKDLTQVHREALSKLVQSLDATGNASLAKLAATLQTTLATAVEKLAQGEALKTIAKADTVKGHTARREALTQAAANLTSSNVAISGLESQQAVNELAAASQALQIAAQSQHDAAAAELQASQDQIQAAHDAAAAQVAAIQDQTQIQVDTLSERGLYGLALQAKMAQVALDQQKQIDDQTVAAQQAHLDQVTAQQHAIIAQAQAAADLTQTQQAAIVAQEQAAADSTAITGAIRLQAAQARSDQAAVQAAIKDAAAQAHVDAVQFGTAAQQRAAQAAQQLINANDANATAVANADLQGVQTSVDYANQNAANAYAQAQAFAAQQNAIQQAALSAANDNASALISAAQAQLQTAQDTASVTEARLQSQVNILQEMANTQYAGGFAAINLYGIDASNPLAYVDALSWYVRTNKA